MYPLLAQTIPDLTHSAGTPTDLSWWGQYGPLGVACAVFAIVIGYLFKLMRTDLKEIAAERIAFAAKQELLKTEYETKHVALSEKYAAALVSEVQQMRTSIVEMRREDADRYEAVAGGQQRTYDQMIIVVGKLTDKLTTTKGRYGS